MTDDTSLSLGYCLTLLIGSLLKAAMDFSGIIDWIRTNVEAMTYQKKSLKLNPDWNGGEQMELAM